MEETYLPLHEEHKELERKGTIKHLEKELEENRSQVTLFSPLQTAVNKVRIKAYIVIINS